MKAGIHPEEYRLVAFKDMSNDDVFITKSTAEAKETITVDGTRVSFGKIGDFQELRIHTTLVRPNWLILQVVSISSRTSTRNSRKKRSKPLFKEYIVSAFVF